MFRTTIVTVLALAVAAASAGAQTFASNPRYSLLNQHTYLLTPSALDYQTARSFSRTFGGHLVAINDGAEQAWLSAAFGGAIDAPRWIGLTDEVSEGIYVWDSGEPVTFTNFCAGEPNNSGNIEDWVEMLPLTAGACWNDVASPATLSIFPSGANQGIIELPFGDRVNFDSLPVTCTPAIFSTPNSEGVSWSGAGTNFRHPHASSQPVDGMPVTGSNYLHLPAEGAQNIPLGGPFPRPVPPGVNEVRVAIPPGTKGVSLFWEFILNETSSAYNDGVSIDVVDAAGSRILNLGYADHTLPPTSLIGSTSYCNSAGLPELPGLPFTASAILPPLTSGAYLSIACWNGVDDFFPSGVNIDAIHFWGHGGIRLDITAPSGPGSLRVQNSLGGAGNTYWTAVTFNPTNFPYGWFFGIDITAADLITEILAGPPFSGTLNGSGGSTFTIPSGVPPGLAIHAVTVQFENPGPFGSTFISASSPRFFLTQ